MLFKSTVAVNTVCQITPALLESMDVKGLLLDLDNTLTTHDNHKPAKGVPEWLKEMDAAGIKMIIVSNNSEERVSPFAAMLGLDFVSHSKKPLSKGFKEARNRMDLPFENLAVVGDQIFTDILGANLKRLKSIYVDPIEHEKTPFFKLKRRLEVPFIPKKRIEIPIFVENETKEEQKRK
ncbi:MAG: YqeG family HAD IIIA-type phosphatase [Oscillospiraceae bacterium]|nr:YqeG family HAD IIIA-type phosphatase [Oscillospiraceae bacterium]